MDLGTIKESSKDSKSDILNEIVIKESDLGKIVAKMDVLDDDIRRLKKDKERIEVEIQDKERDYHREDLEKGILEAEIRELKKKLNRLT